MKTKEKTQQADPALGDASGSAISFPMECVLHLASKSCGCQWNAPMLERNSHWPSCMVGKAQAFLGKRVSWECNGKPCNPPNAELGDAIHGTKAEARAEMEAAGVDVKAFDARVRAIVESGFQNALPNDQAHLQPPDGNGGAQKI